MEESPKLLCVAFDRAITKRYTYGQNHSSPENRPIIENNFSDRDWQAEYFKKAAAAGIFIAIETLHPNEKHVKAYLQALLGDDFGKIIPYIHYRNPSEKAPVNNNDYIEKSIKALGLQGIPPGNVCLLDSNKNNWRRAVLKGYRTVLVVPGNDGYKNELDDFAFGLPPSLHSSSDGRWGSGSGDATPVKTRSRSSFLAFLPPPTANPMKRVRSAGAFMQEPQEPDRRPGFTQSR